MFHNEIPQSNQGLFTVTFLLSYFTDHTCMQHGSKANKVHEGALVSARVLHTAQ